MTPLARNLKRLRLARAMTQVQLAEASGLKQSAISLYESGSDTPELSSLLKLATGLKVPLEALVEGVDVRFDLVYQGLHVTATTDEPPAVSATPTGAATPPPLDPSMDHVLRGMPAPDDHGEGDDDGSEVAAAHAALQRAAADILSAARFLAPRHRAVARDLGSGVRPRAARHGVRKSPAHPKKTAAKRR